MKTRSMMHSQRGVTLVISMILLLLVTLIVTTAYTMNSAGLAAVANIQFRDEAIAASNKAIETVVGSPFTTAPVGQTLAMDINNDGISDYTVTVGVPTCVSATVAGNASLSSTTLGSSMSSASTWNAVWDITATTPDPNSGATVTVRSGTRVLLTQAQKNAVCP